MVDLGKAARLPSDPNSEIERIRNVLHLNEYYLHQKVDSRIGVFS